MKRRLPFGKSLTQLVILSVAVGWLAGGSPAGAETITGTFRYADFNPADGTTVLRPIQFCVVEVHAHRPRPPFGIWTWGKDADATTDANGSISVPRSFQVPGVTYAVKISAQNYAAIVWPNQPISFSPFWQEPGQPDGTPFQRAVNSPGNVANFDYDFTDAWTPQHWSLADAVRHGFDYVAARRDPSESDPLPQAGVQPGFFTTFYNPVNQTLEINGIHIWEDFTILHEYAHFVEHQISHFAAIPTVHDGCTTRDAFGGIVNSAEHAWMEGFAEFFAQAVVLNTPGGTFRGRRGGFGTFTISQLEDTPWADCTGLPPTVTPNMIENVVAGVLWDVFDGVGTCGSSEAHDALSGFDTQVIQILDRELDISRPPTIGDFSAAWFARGLPATPFFDILRRHGLSAPLPPPSLACPGDITVTAGANSCTLPVTFATPTLNQSRRCAAVQCVPPSGTAFPIGVTMVNCRAVESGAVTATCSFNVTVQPNPALPNPNGTGLLGVYYDNPDFTAPRVARTEAVNFDWGLNAPAAGVDAETFSVRWTGKLVPRYTDVYRIFTVSDDGVRLWIDGRQILSAWNDHPPTEHYGDLFLEAGEPYDVVLEMYENGGGAVGKLLWQSTCQPKEPIPASHMLPARLECPTPDRPTFLVNFVNGTPPGTAMFGQAVLDGGWLKLTRPDTSFGIFYIDNFSGNQPVHGFEAKFTAALFGSTCCGNGVFPADGFSFNLVPAATVLPNPDYGQPGEEGLDQGLAVNFDTWDNGGGEGPAVEVKWRGQVIARQPFQASQSPAGIVTARAAAREVLINLASDGILTVSYGGIRVLDGVQTPYTPRVIGTPKWVIGARNGGANDNHWIRDLQIVVNRARIPGLFNTGVDGLGRPLAEDASDPHYVMPFPGGLTTVPWVATAAGGFPIGPWLLDNPDSAWIAPTFNTYAIPNADIRYETTFNLSGLNPAGAAIHGWVAVDDQLVDILLNGQSIAQATTVGPGAFTSWQAFAITSGIQPGVNTLTFIVRNGPGGDNPTGFRVQMCGWATPPPLLNLNIATDSLSTRIWWGSLPHKQYFLEHTDNLSGTWVREAGFYPGAYQAQVTEHHFRVPRDPIRFYRVMEAP
ncbi:MAG TPA: PA14 domain-containing protein [Verrucomicrobiae bacterium]|nr:PA14 domain-containing protein [Verrucomicrobiae bacterium]